MQEYGDGRIMATLQVQIECIDHDRMMERTSSCGVPVTRACKYTSSIDLLSRSDLDVARTHAYPTFVFFISQSKVGMDPHNPLASSCASLLQSLFHFGRLAAYLLFQRGTSNPELSGPPPYHALGGLSGSADIVKDNEHDTLHLRLRNSGTCSSPISPLRAQRPYSRQLSPKVASEGEFLKCLCSNDIFLPILFLTTTTMSTTEKALLPLPHWQPPPVSKEDHEWANILTVDLSKYDTDRDELVKTVETALSRDGFFYVVNHGLTQETVNLILLRELMA